MKQQVKMSEKEQEIISHLVKGLTNEEIAVNCGVSVNTIKTHLKSIYRKLGVNNRTQVAFKMCML
jgi:LuxR family transcriptional regulator, maltose regulon positive regulatory protein